MGSGPGHNGPMGFSKIKLRLGVEGSESEKTGATTRMKLGSNTSASS